MTSPENKLFCRLDHEPGSDQEKERISILSELGLLEAESVPIFEEATQMVAHFLDTPICVLGLIDRDRVWFKSAVGLSRIGLMNDLASSRQLPRHESCCTQVVDSRQVLVINDTAAHPVYESSILVQRYGIRAYLGVPLLTSSGHCLGTLAVMQLVPRQFTSKDVEFLELTARWSMSEFERNYLLKKQTSLPPKSTPEIPANSEAAEAPLLAHSIKANLITQMTQELRTPLTSILGMASMLNREIYGPLTEKQKEYMDIVHNSGQYLLALVNEILELGSLDESTQQLNLSPVDIEMLCQQALNTLNQAAQRREQQIRLTVEPGHRIWLLDKDKVRQMLYHLVFGVIQSSTTGSVIRIHVSRKPQQLNITIWTSHPWLGEGLPQSEIHANPLLVSTSTPSAEEYWGGTRVPGEHGFEDEVELVKGGSAHGQAAEKTTLFRPNSRRSLGLLLSRQLAEMHSGRIILQGSGEAGYRYVIILPQMTATNPAL